MSEYVTDYRIHGYLYPDDMELLYNALALCAEYSFTGNDEDKGSFSNILAYCGVPMDSIRNDYRCEGSIVDLELTSDKADLWVYTKSSWSMQPDALLYLISAVTPRLFSDITYFSESETGEMMSNDPNEVGRYSLNSYEGDNTEIDRIVYTKNKCMSLDDLKLCCLEICREGNASVPFFDDDTVAGEIAMECLSKIGVSVSVVKREELQAGFDPTQVALPDNAPVMELIATHLAERGGYVR